MLNNIFNLKNNIVFDRHKLNHEIGYLKKYYSNINLIIKLLMYMETLIHKKGILSNQKEKEIYEEKIHKILDNIRDTVKKNCYTDTYRKEINILSDMSERLIYYFGYENCDVGLGSIDYIIYDLQLNSDFMKSKTKFNEKDEIDNTNGNCAYLFEVDFSNKKKEEKSIFIIKEVSQKLIDKIKYYQEKLITLEYLYKELFCQ